jgi:hypothetical protein
MTVPEKERKKKGGVVRKALTGCRREKQTSDPGM